MNFRNALLLAAIVAATSLTQIQASIITVPTDPIGGGNLSGTTFTIGSAPLVSNTNTWPATENPANAINNDAGVTKYLNGDALNSGYIVTPAVGLSKVTGISFTTANDTVARDPASYSLYGSTTVAASSTPGNTFNLSDFTLISSGALSLPSARFDSSVSVSFADSGNWTTYLLVFPTVKDGGADGHMQIGDAILTGQATPEPASLVLAGLGAIGLFVVARGRRRA